jgi:hypothetical protein
MILSRGAVPLRTKGQAYHRIPRPGLVKANWIYRKSRVSKRDLDRLRKFWNRLERRTSGAKQAAEKLGTEQNPNPQRLKPQGF